MNNRRYIADLFKNDDFFYVTTDVKRALGLEDVLPNFHIITSFYDPFIPLLRNKNIDVFCLEEEIKGDNLPKSSGSILADAKATEYIFKKSKKPLILSFKPSESIEKVCMKVGSYKYIGNTRELNEKFEDKINFYQILKDHIKENTIPSVVGPFGKLIYTHIKDQLGDSVVVQFGKGWAGKTSFFIENEENFEDLKKKFSQTIVRVSKRIIGNTFLNNSCIYKKSVFQSFPAIQINGISWLNRNPLSTSGREWGNKFLTPSEEKKIKQLTEKIGRILIKSGYHGYFGLDFITDLENQQIYITEINARFTASTPFYTKLELGNEILPLYVYHLAEFLGKDIKKGYTRHEEIEGCEVNIEYGEERKTGTYGIENTSSLSFKNESYDPSLLQKENEMVLITGQKNSSKLETNYPLLEKPEKFHEKFERVLKSIVKSS